MEEFFNKERINELKDRVIEKIIKTKNLKENNYVEGCWAFRVYEPIDIKYVNEKIQT